MIKFVLKVHERNYASVIFLRVIGFCLGDRKCVTSLGFVYFDNKLCFRETNLLLFSRQNLKCSCIYSYFESDKDAVSVDVSFNQENILQSNLALRSYCLPL